MIARPSDQLGETDAARIAELDEDVANAIAQFLEEVDAADTREQVEKLWREASGNGWMEHRVGGSRVGDRLTAAVERVKAAAASKSQAVA